MFLLYLLINGFVPFLLGRCVGSECRCFSPSYEGLAEKRLGGFLFCLLFSILVSVGFGATVFEATGGQRAAGLTLLCGLLLSTAVYWLSCSVAEGR